MIKRTIIHLLLRILLVPAIPFFATIYIFHGLEDDRHGIKLMVVIFVTILFTILYLFIESIVFFIRDDYKSFKLNVISFYNHCIGIIVLLLLCFMTKTFREIMELDTAFR